MTRLHHRSTVTCEREIQALKQQPKTYTVAVELITEEVEDDGYGYPVPVDDLIITLVVPKLDRELIERIVATRSDLRGYVVMSFWQQLDDYDDDII